MPAETTASTQKKENTKSKKESSNRDAFRPCSRVLSGGKISRETNWKTGIEEKDQFNQQQGWKRVKARRIDCIYREPAMNAGRNGLYSLKISTKITNRRLK